MNYRRLGQTDLMVSEIGLGGEWLERHNTEEVKKVIDQCEKEGINILDCWMSEPNVRSNIGLGIKGKRERWIIQGHIGSTWQNGQYVRTREIAQVQVAFEDLLTRLQTDYIDLGMIHFVDSPFGVALTPIQCIHYALTRPGVAAVMAGFDTPEQVKDSVAYETASEEEKDYATVLAHAPRHAFNGQCTYCGHCKPCPKDIDIAMVNKLYDLAMIQSEVPASLKAHYEALKTTAADCIGCGGCETRCPFGVPIVERMKKTRELFC